MHTQNSLPEEYGVLEKVDLQKDKKKALLVNGLSLAIGVVLFLIGEWIRPLRYMDALDEAFESGSFGSLILRLAVFFVGSIVYLILHEAVHGICMRRFSRAKVRYGFTGLYAFAGSDAYFCRRDYRIIAMAPVVVWGVIFAVLQVLVPDGWFWVIYALQIVNVGGAAGDIYMTVHVSRLPAEILVQDTGVAMTIFAPNGAVQPHA